MAINVLAMQDEAAALTITTRDSKSTQGGQREPEKGAAKPQ